MTYTLNNNLKIFLKSKQGVELKDWIEEHKHELKNHRIFYIVKGNVFRHYFFSFWLLPDTNSLTIDGFEFKFWLQITHQNNFKSI